MRVSSKGIQKFERNLSFSTKLIEKTFLRKERTIWFFFWQHPKNNKGFLRAYFHKSCYKVQCNMVQNKTSKNFPYFLDALSIPTNVVAFVYTLE
jgi:hypothetical protein